MASQLRRIVTEDDDKNVTQAPDGQFLLRDSNGRYLTCLALIQAPTFRLPRPSMMVRLQTSISGQPLPTATVHGR